MTAASIRMMKEVRIVAWPWTAVVGLAMLSAILQRLHQSWGPLNAESATAFSFFVGVPLLAGLSIGSEFQYRTIGLSLSQPVGREQIWLAKILSSFLAAFPVGVFLYFRGSSDFNQFFYHNPWLLLGFLAVATAAAFPMTLVARSTIGGLALQMLSTTPFAWFVAWIDSYRHYAPLTRPLIAMVVVAELVYAAALVWLGRTLFLRFQAVEGMQAIEATLPGSALVPSFLADWFRCRPSGMVLNLIRREMRLLRALAPLTLLVMAAWICLVTFHVLPLTDKDYGFKAALVVFTAVLSILIALLAGVLSLGEEKSWGTYDWQLTLPASPALQWLVKLTVALFVSVIGGAALPIGVLTFAGWLHGNGLAYLSDGLIWAWPLEMAGITFAAFWSACLLKGTVRAALLTFPACLVVAAGAPLGEWLADLAPTSAAVRWLIYLFGPMRSIKISAVGMNLFDFSRPAFLIVPLCVVLIIAAVQSLRLFRRLFTDSKLRVLRKLQPLFLTMLVFTFCYGLFFTFVVHSYRTQRDLTRELNRAILTSFPNPIAPFQITAEQLSQHAPFSPELHRWLDGSTIAVVPNPSFTMAKAPSSFAFGFLESAPADHVGNPYSAVIRFHDSSCSISYRRPVAKVAVFALICN